ncbi:aldehyde dehydrogenase family protein [Nonomuraea insulae]|uniref:Aldehyde dehydrogenase family protein n=1 Tax=Nonomuraea insulae TaxID=1616787 RepID=A0ABW1CG96_9ACTN
MVRPRSIALAALTGSVLIGESAIAPAAAMFRAVAPITGEEVGPGFAECGAEEVNRAADLASEAFGGYRRTSSRERAAFLEPIADEIEARAGAIAERAMLEPGLPSARLADGTAHTTGQLRLFAKLLLEGGWLQVQIDPGDPERTPLPRPDVRRRSVPLGPVAPSGVSNFPLAFSVTGAPPSRPSPPAHRWWSRRIPPTPAPPRASERRSSRRHGLGGNLIPPPGQRSRARHHARVPPGDHGRGIDRFAHRRACAHRTRAIELFLRPVAYQNVPAELLPTESRDDNPLRVFRRIDGLQR